MSAAVVADNPYPSEALALDPGIVAHDPWRREPPGVQAYMESKQLQRRYAWAIPSDGALKAIAAWSPIVEIGAGTGYWASLLAAMGADVIAYDTHPGRNKWCDADLYYSVLVGDHTKAAEHSDRTLMLCWPPYVNDMAEQALAMYRGRRLVYIGEHYGGCCASDAFFNALERDWREVRKIAIPQWYGLHDAVWLYERKEGAR